MKQRWLIMFLLFIGLGVISCQKGQNKMEDQALRSKAEKLAKEFIIVDTHIDTPYQLQKHWVDITQPTKLNFDYPKAEAGALNVAFMSIYVSPEFQQNGAKAAADSMIDLVEGIARQYPNTFAIGTDIATIKQQVQRGKISLPMGMENGAPLEGNLDNLTYFYDRGIRYITLTHSKWNHIGDSSYDPDKHWNGLSPFGKKLIPAMNKIGMIIDVSHVSDSTFYQVLELSKAPVVATHSACRYFTPGFERNMSDDMIKKLAAKGGVIQINFGSYFVNDANRKAADKAGKNIRKYLKEHGIDEHSEQAESYAEEYRRKHPAPEATIQDVADQIDHVVKLVGIDYVGLGSDFDGVRELPKGLENVSKFPNLIYELLKRGYSKEDIHKICSENFFRVWTKIETVAKKLQMGSTL